MFAPPPSLKNIALSLNDESRALLGQYFKAAWIAAAAQTPDSMHPHKADGIKTAMKAAYHDLCAVPNGDELPPETH